MALVNGTPRSALSNGSSKMPSVAKETAAMTRGPRTRRQHSLAKKREDNEQRSMLLQLNDDVLEKVLSFLEGRDLAVLETVCTHFRYGSWVAANRVAMPERPTNAAAAQKRPWFINAAQMVSSAPKPTKLMETN